MSMKGAGASPPPTLMDDNDNPFMEHPIEAAVPVAIAIPLPQSPTSSILVESTTLGRSAGKVAAQAAQVSFGSNSTPAMVPTHVAHPLSPSSSRHSGPRHRASRSISSNVSSNGANVLSPPQFGRAPGSPIARPMSSSGISDNASLVSATPSRDWTEGGTADIFSGSEKDFHEQDSDVEDLKSISDSGSWEDVRNAGHAA